MAIRTCSDDATVAIFGSDGPTTEARHCGQRPAKKPCDQACRRRGGVGRGLGSRTPRWSSPTRERCAGRRAQGC
jgi:hypothetical protein